MLLKRCDNVYGSELDNQVCLFNYDSAKYYILNSTGSIVWDLLSEPKTKKEIITSFLKNFEVSKSQCVAEVEEFISDALEKGIFKTF